MTALGGKMKDDILFTIKLAADDWDTGTRAWRCPALEIPSAFIKGAFDPKGQPLATELLKIDKGPARVTWRGSGQPSQITLVVGLGEELSPSSNVRFWRRLAIVAPIIAALMGALATHLTTPLPGPSPRPSDHVLRLRVDPNDAEASGLPPAKIIVNNEEIKQLVNYKVDSDVMAVVDVSKAFSLAKTLNQANREQQYRATRSVGEIKIVLEQLNDLDNEMNASCIGGIGRRGALREQTIAIYQKLNNIAAGLGSLSITTP
jgi:hypothetical protein